MYGFELWVGDSGCRCVPFLAVLGFENHFSRLQRLFGMFLSLPTFPIKHAERDPGFRSLAGCSPINVSNIGA